MFVASYARLPPGSRFHLSVNVQIYPCNALYNIGFLRLQSGLGRTVYYSARYHLGATSLRLGPFITMRGTASVPLGPSVPNARYRLGTARALHYNARYRLGTARALYNNVRYRLGTNARYRLGTASVPLGPSITMRGTDTPFAFYKVLIGSE